MVVVLITGKTGEFVARVEIPPFPNQAFPDVVIWGSRTFLRSAKGWTPPETRQRPVYEEVFAVVSLTPSPGLPSDVAF